MNAAKPELIEAVWAHGRVMPEADGAHWRQDSCGAWIRREHFGREDGDFGWKLEKITAGGPDTAESLRPYHWRNDYDVATGHAHCRIMADRSGVAAEKHASPPRNRPL
jgi:hypothetical protein